MYGSIRIGNASIYSPKIYLIGIITMKKVNPYQRYVINLMYLTKQ